MDILKVIRKLLAFILTTFFIAILLTIFFAITEGSSLLVIGIFFTGALPFVLLIGVPLSFLSDYLTKRLNGKPRTILAFLIHIIFGLLAGLVIIMSNLLEGFIIVVATIIASLIFGLVDEVLRQKFVKYSKG